MAGSPGGGSNFLKAPKCHRVPRGGPPCAQWGPLCPAPDVPCSPQAQHVPAHTSPLSAMPLSESLSWVRWAPPKEGPSLGGGPERPLEVRGDGELPSSFSFGVSHVLPLT